MRIDLEFDITARLVREIEAIVGKEVLVGIPASADDRGKELGNVARGYLNEFGEPSTNLPARAHLVPGVEKALGPIEKVLEDGIKKALGGITGASVIALEKAGFLAENSVKDLITSVIPPPLAQRTIENRRKRAKNKRGAVTTVPLIDTGEYRRAITHVIRKV